MSRTSSQPTTPSALPSLVPHGRFKGKPGISLSRPVTVVGSRNRSHVHLVSAQVSKSHAMVVNGGSAGCYVRDLASRSHVLINGQQVKEAELKDGDVLGIGPFTFRFTDPNNKKPRRRGGVQTNIAAGALRISTRTLPFTLDARTTLIGRRPTCDVALDDMDVSTTHAVVFELDGKRYIRDLGSRTGTFVNGTAIHQQALEFGDEIKIGPAVMTYAEAGELGIGSGLGSGLHDGTEDLAATAHLPAVDAAHDLVFEEPPAKPVRPARPVRKAPTPPPPVPMPVEQEAVEAVEAIEPVEAAEAIEPVESAEPAPMAPIASELDLALAPEAPADVDELDLAALESAAEAELPSAAVPEIVEPSQESALGIELLSQEEEQAAAPVAEAPAAKSADVGGIDDLVLAPIPAKPVEAAPPIDVPAPPAPVVEVGPAAPAPEPEPEPAVVARDVNELPELPPELAEELELEPVDLDDVEVLAKTEPTPESALDLEHALPGAEQAALEPQASAPAAPPAELLSDSMFGREVEAFEGPGTGPIVEAPRAAAEAEIPAEPPSAETAPAAAELSPLVAPDVEPEADALIFEEPAPAAPAAAAVEVEVEPEAEAASVAETVAPVEAIEPATTEPAMPPLTLDHTVTPSEPELSGAIESPVEPLLPAAAAEVVEPELDLELAPAADAEIAPATADHEPAPAEPDLAELDLAAATKAAPEVERLAEPAAEEALDVDALSAPIDPVVEAPAAEELDLAAIEPISESSAAAIPAELEIEPGPAAVVELIPEIPALAEAETQAEPAPAAEAEIPESAEALAKAEDEVEKWYRDHAEHPELIERPEGVPASAEATTPVAPGLAEPAAAAEPFPIDPELLGEGPEATPPEASDELVFQEPAAPPEVSAAPVAEAPATPVGERPAEPTAEAPGEPPPGKPTDLFFGLERDTASFLGGMPLQLPPLNSPFAQQRVDFAGPAQPPAAPQAPVAPPSAPEPEPEPAAAELEEPLPEFDHEAYEYPEDEAQPTAESAQPAAAPETPAPVAPVAPATGRSGRPAPPPPARSTRERQPRGDAQGPERRVAASPFDLNFEDVPTDRIEIPPFGGAPASATLGHVTTAFDGLAMPPVRETDVFSGRAPGSPAGGGGGAGTPAIPPFPGGTTSSAAAEDEEAFDEDVNEQGLEPLDLSDAEHGEGVPSADESSTGDASLPGSDALASADAQRPPTAAAAGAESRRARPLAQPNRRPPAYPTDPATPATKKKRWRIGKWGIFGLMMVCMIAVSAAMALWIRTQPNTSTVVATIEFERLDALTDAERQKVLGEQRAKLTKPEVRAAARNILPGMQANLAAGFLDERGGQSGPAMASAVAFSKFVDSLQLAPGKAMRLRHATGDPAGDAVRVRAVLAALYAENKPLIDAKGEIDHARDEKQELLRTKQAQLSTLEDALAAARQASGEGDAVTRKAAMISALETENRRLYNAWYQKTSAVNKINAELRAAESDVPVAVDATKQPAQPDEDAQVVELTQKAKALADGLKAKKAEAAAKSEEARKSLAAAIKQFEDDITKARGEMKPDSELARYIEQAELTHSKLKTISGELDQRQRSDMERLTTLKRNLSDANELRIREAFAADAPLKKLQETLAMKERQRGSALGGGLKDDAKALDKEINALKLEIESRQDLLTTADGVAPRMKDLEDLINDFLTQMDRDRVRNDQRMAELLKQLAVQAPVAGSLPAEQKAFAEQLNKRQQELEKARERYAAAADAAAAESDAQLKSMESDLAAAQAKVDERKKQVADAARAELSADQQKDRTAITEALRHKLQIAQQEDREAGEAFNKNRLALEDAKSDLEKAKQTATQFVKEDARKRQLDSEIKTLSDEVQRLTKQQETAIVPLKPGDDSVGTIGAQADHRLTYMLGALLAIVLVFLPLLVMAPAHPELATDPGADLAFDHDGNGDGDGSLDAFDSVADLPFAAPRVPDDGALAAARKVEVATDSATAARSGRNEAAPLGA